MVELDDDPTPSREIPRVAELCQALGLEGSSRQFRKYLMSWRKHYRTASGVSGLDVTNWASVTDRYDLGVMAQEYLKIDGHALYWPSNGPASPQARLEYPKDENIIAGFLRRLFWRQNEAAAKNAKRKVRKPQSTEDSTAVKDEIWERPRHGLPDVSVDLMGGLPLVKPSGCLESPIMNVQDTTMRGDSRRPIILEDEDDRNEGERGPLVKLVTLKYKRSQGRQEHQSFRIHAPTVRMVSTSPSSNNDDLEDTSPSSNNDKSEDEDYMPGSASRRKRRHSSRSDCIRSIVKYTKRIHRPESPGPGRILSAEIAGGEDPDCMLTALKSRDQRQTLSDVAYETVTSSKTYYNTGDANLSPSNTSPLGPLNGSTLDPEDLIQRENENARKFLSEDTTHHVHVTLLPSPTSDPAASRTVNNERIHVRDGTELGDSERSQMQPSPSRLNPSPSTQARNDQTGPVVKAGIEIIVVALCNSRFTIKKWPAGTLKDKDLGTIFDEVSALVTEKDIQRIDFKLETLKKDNDLNCLIERGDTAIFEVMIEKFNERIKERKRAGETRFKILLELDPEQQCLEKAKVAQESESDGEMW